MKRRFAAFAAVSLGVLTACGGYAPPADELANELIDTLAVNEAVKDCMHAVVDDFSLSEEDAMGFTDFGDVAEKAADGNERALQILADFEAALTACN